MIKIKRITTKQDLIDALCMIYEDMCTFNIANTDAINLMSKVIDLVRHEKEKTE